jgi:NADPH:quinone reductase-like Zn-dependent oxidoreductase
MLILSLPQKEKAVLVLGGSGGVGTFAVQLAKRHWDCFVVASCSAKNADLVSSLGADKVSTEINELRGCGPRGSRQGGGEG